MKIMARGMVAMAAVAVMFGGGGMAFAQTLSYEPPEQMAASQSEDRFQAVIFRTDDAPRPWTPWFGYARSLSGNDYLQTAIELEVWNSLRLDAIAGMRFDGVPAPGVGLGYRRERDKWAVAAGVAVLFPQNAAIDVAFSLTFSIRARHVIEQDRET